MWRQSSELEYHWDTGKKWCTRRHTYSYSYIHEVPYQTTAVEELWLRMRSSLSFWYRVPGVLVCTTRRRASVWLNKYAQHSRFIYSRRNSVSKYYQYCFTCLSNSRSTK